MRFGGAESRAALPCYNRITVLLIVVALRNEW
jgi:hypothetical protein